MKHIVKVRDSKSKAYLCYKEDVVLWNEMRGKIHCSDKRILNKKFMKNPAQVFRYISDDKHKEIFMPRVQYEIRVQYELRVQYEQTVQYEI